MILSYLQWVDITERGTSGDQVHDILASWKADAYKWLEKNSKLEAENAALKAAKVRHLASELPPLWKPVLLCFEANRFYVGYHSGTRYCISLLYSDNIPEVKGWYELPAPPEVQGEK